MDKSLEDYPTAESDRLSELPESLILVILAFLPILEVVRTTILSKRWKDLWITVPCLDFCGEHPSFIEGALAKWKGAKIHEFSLGFWPDDPPPSHIIDSWLLLSIDKQVEQLFLDFGPCMEYCLPQRLYSCSSITKLFLYFCKLEIGENVNVQWNQLKSLTIEQPRDFGEDDIDRILSGVPLLEELELVYWEIIENLNIESSSLKMLKINMYIYDFHGFVGNLPVLRICAPNLESLEISGLWHARCLLNVPSLTDANLVFDHQYNYVLNEPSHCKVLEEIFRQAFLSLSHVEKLTLNECFIKFFLDEMKKDKYVLFPKLVVLNVELDKYRTYSLVDENQSLAPKTIFSGLFLLQLKTIVITWDLCDDSIFPVVEILLENARALEKMVLRLRNHEANPEMFILAEEKVLSMQRAAANAKVIISKDR